MSAQDKLDRSAAKHGLGSDERKRKIQKAKDFFSKPVPTYSKDELRKMGHPVEQNESRFDIAIPAPKGSNKNTDKQRAAKAARRAANRAKTDTTKIDKAVAKDKARSASGSLTRTDDHRRKNYQTGKSGAHFSKYESSAEYGKSMDRIRDKEKNAAIKPKDRETLGKLADLMKKQKRNEAYRKPTQAEIDADRKKDRKGKDTSDRYRNMKKKMYGNAMRGKVESTNLEEALVKVTDVEFNYRDQLPNSPKTSDLGAIKDEWRQDRIALRDAVKKMGGLVTNTVAPSRGNKWVGTVTIGTRGDPSKLDDKSIQKAVKRHGIEIRDNQFRESTNLEEQKFAVKYTHPTDKKSGRTTGPMSKAAADKKAAMGNRVDRVGGKYAVIPHVEAAGQEYTAAPIKTGDVSQADRLTIAKMDAIMKKRSKDKRQKESSLPPHLQKIIGKGGQIDKKKVDQHVHGKKTKVTDVTPKGYGPKEEIVQEDWKADSARRMRNQRIANEPYRGPSGPDTRTDAERMADRAKLAKRFAADKAKQDKAVSSKKESVSSADKKPQNFRDPETGKMKVRMVPVDRDVVRGDDAAKVVRKKRFKHLRSK